MQVSNFDLGAAEYHRFINCHSLLPMVWPELFRKKNSFIPVNNTQYFLALKINLLHQIEVGYPVN